MFNTNSLQGKHRLTQRKKDANNKQWYKDQADLLDTISLTNGGISGFGEISEQKRMKVNYDLFNNIIDPKDFAYVCQPFGAEIGELPANFTNRDIVSGKIKVLLGMEMKMPFSWKVLAVNEEATTRKEEEEFGRIRDYVVSEAMKPIRMQAERAAKEQAKGKPLTPEENQDLQDQIEQEIEAKTPDKVRKYMLREHQDPAEALSRQLLEYLIPEKRIQFKFNKGWKHSNLSGKEIYWVGQLNGEPDMKVVNPMYFDHDTSPDLDFIEDGEWAVCEYRMTPSEVVANFGSDLTEAEIDKVYTYADDPSRVADADFTFTNNTADDPYTVRVLHTTWKSLRLIKFLTYKDENGKPQEMLVNEDYKLNPDIGDLKLEKEWIPEVHECYKILSDIYVHARPVLGQEKDLDNLWECKLPYYGAVCDNLNSPVTAPMDRMKTYQYFYNIVIYRIELLMASDKGKILAANINAIPKSSGIDVQKWTYFMEANKIAWFNPQEEGNRGSGDVTNMVKEIDMSLVSDIEKYMRIAEYIERRCGASIGVTPQMEAQIGANDAVTNTQQNLVQASYIIQPYFELHNVVKANTLDAFLDQAKIAYSQRQPAKLSYVLDDMSMKLLTINPKLLGNSKYGLFVSNSAKAADAKKAVENLAQAALQNQQIDLGDIIRVIKSDSINEAEELLDAAQDKKVAQSQATEMAKLKQQKQIQAAATEQQDRLWKHEGDMIVLKAREERKTKLQVEAMAAMGFDPNKDEDGDGEPDVFEVYKHGVDTDLKTRKLNLEEQQFEHDRSVDREKLNLENKKIKVMGQKKAATTK